MRVSDPSIAEDETFFPPAFLPPDRPPGPLAVWRSLRTAIDGWPREVFSGGAHRTWFPGAPLIIADPALAAEALIERSDEFPHGAIMNRVFAPIWGDGIFVTEGTEWRWQRQAAARAFRPAQLAALVPGIRAVADETLGRWQARRVINLQDEARRLTLKVLLGSLFSADKEFPDIDEASRQAAALIDAVGRIQPTDLLPVPDYWLPSTRGRGGSAAAYLRSRLDAMIAKRRRAGQPKGDLVDMLMSAQDGRSGRRMDNARLRDNLLGFIAAGHDATAFALSWSLWMVANHGRTRDRLVAEIEDVAGSGPIEAHHLERLVFTRQVLQETMRLFPAAVAIARAAARDNRLGGHSVRRGGTVLIAVYALHRLRRFWEEPRAFDPDRFGPGQLSARPQGLYLPFGAGPRNCMGAAFAMTELLTVLATLVRGARLRPQFPNEVEITVRLGAVVAKNGLWAIPEPAS